MKKNLLLLILFLSTIMYSQEYKEMISSGKFTVQEIQTKANDYFKDRDKGKGSGYVQYKRWEYFALRQRDANGFVKSRVELFDEWENYLQVQNQKNANTSRNFNDDWSEMGPSYWTQTSGWNPGVGRLSSMAVQESNENHIVVGSIGGGIWKTNDGGINWQPLTDNYGNMYVYSIAIDPNNVSTYYWGSSNGRIYKSTDAGNVWIQMSNAGFRSVTKILIHPSNSNIVFAVSTSGLYKSINGGNSWSQVIANSMYDVEFDPNDSTKLFASGIGTSGFYKSTDGGDNFALISGFSSGPKMIGISKADSNKIYVVEASGSIFGGFYRSTDNGDNFTMLDHQFINYFGYESDGADSRGQAPRDMGITVSPTNADEVHIAGINTWRSTDGGDSFTITSQWVPQNASFENIGYCHADVDDIEFFGNNMYVVTDGGIFICEDSENVNTNYYRDLTTGIGIRQFYLMGISQTDPVIISSGSQDNGASIFKQDGKWYDWLGADGFECIIDVNDSNTIYGTIYNGITFKSTNQGDNITQISVPETTGWITPLEQDSDGNLYFGGREVHKSTDGGDTWNSISQNFGNLTNQVKIAPSNNQIIYAASNSGSDLFRTSNGGENNSDWDELTGFIGFINSIAVHPKDPNKVAIAVTGSSEKVYVTNDGGQNWQPYSTGLPNFTVYAIVWDNNSRDGLYVGMDYGIYYIDNQFSEWNLYSNKLPNVRVTELEINYADDHLYASTYGRGIWKTPRSTNVLSTNTEIFEALNVFPNPTSDKINISWNQSDDISVRLYNLKGQLLYLNKKVSLVEKPLSIDTNQLATGVYFLKINSTKGSITKKVVVK